jgi:hypothetical protein
MVTQHTKLGDFIREQPLLGPSSSSGTQLPVQHADKSGRRRDGIEEKTRPKRGID